MFGRIRSEFQFWKEKVRIPMFGKIRSEFQCLDK